MTGRRYGPIIVCLLLVGAASVAAGGANPTGQVLEIAADGSGEVLLALPVEAGTPVVLDYTHSVERTPIRDHYEVRDGELLMIRMEFQSYGWGLPAGAEVTRKNGTYVTELNESFSELTVAPGALAGHRLTVGDHTVDLVELADGRSVRIAVRDRSPVPGERTSSRNPLQ